VLAESFEVADLREWGFEEAELPTISPATGATDADAVPEAPETPRTRVGDMWLLGEHRVLCGNSADHDVVIKVMGGDLAQCVFTDPPYGVSIGKKNVMLNSFQKAGRNLADIVDDDLSPDQLLKALAPVFAEIKNTVMAEDCTVFVCSPQGGGLGMMMMMMMMMKEYCYEARHVLIWKKNCPTFSMGRLDYDYQHEPILLTWGKRHKRPMLGAHKTSVWEVDKPRENKAHPTMKPVELYINGFLNNSDPGDVVFDPYCGSGTCIIAAEQTGRLARGIEISPHYCDVIVKRWMEFTGKEAVREDGVFWSDVS
jgi:DNA modification methylase